MYEINKDVIFVPGAVHGAIYDFNSGKVYSVNDAACSIIHRYVENKAVPSDETYLTELKRCFLISENFIPRNFRLRKDKTIQLEMAWIEITQRCNLRCIHCYEGNVHVSSENSLSLAQWKKCIDQLADLHIKRLIVIGGEPCCRKDLVDILEYASQYPMDITLFTNATAFSERLVHCVVKHAIRVKISMYGPSAEIHDKITNVRGSFKKTTEAVQALVAQGVSVSAAVIVMKENEAYVDETMQYVRELGMKCSRYDIIRNVHGGTQKLHAPTNKEVIQKVYLTKPNFKAKKEQFYHNYSRNSCWYGKITIMENGDVIPCEFERNYRYGNILQDSLEEIIHNEKTMSKWFFDFSTIESCKDCEFRFACYDCRPLGLSVCGSMNTKNPRCCYDVYRGVWDLDSLQ